MGVWIETFDWFREQLAVAVTPFVGVWIETNRAVECSGRTTVTPFVGVWIETIQIMINMRNLWSHPSWVCGLKLDVLVNRYFEVRHTLRGCVD